MVNTSFSFTFLPDQDRILLWFRSDEEGGVPEPVFLTRRMTRILGGFLRKALEKVSDLPDHVGEEDLSEYMQFFHDQELESAPLQWTADRPAAPSGPDAQAFRLVTRIDANNNGTHLVLSCFDDTVFLVRITLDWPGVHRFLHSLIQMARMADWGLAEELGWKVPAGRDDILQHRIN